VRAVGRAAALSRLPVEIAIADVRDREAMEAAVLGCDVLFHCARGTDGSLRDRRLTDVEGTRNVLDASLRQRVGRVVHVSTVVVYELPAAGELDERAPYSRDRDPYAAAKREAEQLAREYARLLPVTVVQPTNVYGPHAGVYGRDIIEELRSTRIPLVNGGTGICNAVYVDDLVDAMLLAATGERAPGETFLVSGPEHPTWAEFYAAFERMLGVERTVPMSEREAIEHWRRSTRRPWLARQAIAAVRGDPDLRAELLATREGAVVRRVAERVLPASFFAPERWVDRRRTAPPQPSEPPLAAFKPQLVHYLASRAQVRIDKARALLGYEPRFGLDAGMRLTEAWARWAGLLPADDRA
jgi:nucleoside-diphosphate-sugar epimerase